MTSPYITTQEAAEYLLFVDRATGKPDLARLHQFLNRYRATVLTVKRGRAVLVDKASLDAHLTRNRRSHVRNSAASSSTNQFNGVERTV